MTGEIKSFCHFEHTVYSGNQLVECMKCWCIDTTRDIEVGFPVLDILALGVPNA